MQSYSKHHWINILKFQRMAFKIGIVVGGILAGILKFIFLGIGKFIFYIIFGGIFEILKYLFFE